MPSVPVRTFAVLIMTLGGGCATPHDPEASRYSLETRAQETGRARSDGGLRLFARRSIGRSPAAAPDRFAPPTAGAAAPDTPAGRQLAWLVTQFNGPTFRDLSSRLSQEFLAKTPEQTLRSAIAQWKRDEFADGSAEVHDIEDASLGRITAVVRGRTTDRFCRVRLSTDKWGRISSLSLAALVDYTPGALAEWSRIDAKVESLTGTTGIAAYEITDRDLLPIHRFQADVPLAIEALAGLYIAGALTEAVAAGEARWDEPMPIADEFKSLMGGRMQLEAEESEFPLSQYLSLMLGEGDTTAFDHLLLRAGRPRVERYMSRFCTAPQRNRPFLATMEYYRIKLGSDRSIPGKFGSADEPARQVLLSAGGPVEKSVPSLAAAGNWRRPFEVERIGWFASADDLCKVLADLSRTSRQTGMEPLANALRMTDAMEPSSTWTTAAFKSGSEPGVLAMTWLLERHDGRRFVLAMLANDPARPVRQSELADCAAAAVRLLGRTDTKK